MRAYTSSLPAYGY
ncbi:hypothetical protein VTL71DRAFT_6447 [Oculimacula yallundae]|uniref:Uncharacterized protein n=1 Tax=Oculimacula yallundae TaxID=86028 RepID=A0ABR4BY50_9HELO